MIFARYIGTDKDSGCTPGKVYLVEPEMESESAVSYGFITFTNDTGIEMRSYPKNQRDEVWKLEIIYDFEFLKEVYAVITKPEVFKMNFNKGKVVVLDEGGKSQSNIVGYGYASMEGLTILDHTNVFPGMIIRNVLTDEWVKIRIVDEALWVVVEWQEGALSLEKFMFAVDADGDIQIEPFIRCVNNLGVESELTFGHQYRVVKGNIYGDGLICIINDKMVVVDYSAGRFK
jgi:hypothetical protein